MKTLLLICIAFVSISVYGQNNLLTPEAFRLPKYANQAAIDVSNPSPTDGLMVYDNTERRTKQYNLGCACWIALLPLYSVNTLNVNGTILKITNSNTFTAHGIQGETNSQTFGKGIYGLALNTSPSSETYGVFGNNASTNANGYGVFGNHAGAGVGVGGSSSSGDGVSGYSSSGVGVHGYSNTSYAVYGQSSSIGVYGYNSSSGIGTQGFSTSGDGVKGLSTSGNGGYFSSTSGNAIITGTGKIGLGTTTPTNSYLVVNGKVGASHAIFGDNTSGVSIESAYPGISFNGYYNAGRKAIVNGFVGGIAMDPSNGSIIIYNTSSAGTANNNTSPIDRITILNNGNTTISGGISVGGGETIAKIIKTTVSHDLPSILAGGSIESNIPVPGVAAGDVAVVNIDAVLGVLILSNVRVVSSNFVSVSIYNPSGASVDRSPIDFRIVVFK